MKTRKLASLVCSSVCTLSATVAQATWVPGTSDPWLAGSPNGTTASFEDSAPGQSPVLAPIAIVGGQGYQFVVTGSANNISSPSGLTPDGGDLYPHSTGAENGIAGLTAPINSLIGVFLPAGAPNSTDAGLNFYTIGLNFSELSPGLNTPFFIGDGSNGSGLQTFIAPTGATRLYLGTMDGYGWDNNYGGFDVTVRALSPVPEPSTVIAGALMLAPFGMTALRSLRKKRK